MCSYHFYRNVIFGEQHSRQISKHLFKLQDRKCPAKIACQLQSGQSFIIFLEISVSIKLIVDIYMHFFNLLRMTKDFPC